MKIKNFSIAELPLLSVVRVHIHRYSSMYTSWLGSSQKNQVTRGDEDDVSRMCAVSSSKQKSIM